MSIVTVVEDDYLYKMKLFYRKIIPSKEILYLPFFIVKFFPLVLLTHAIRPNNDSHIFTLSKVIRALTIFNHNYVFSYYPICYIIYGLLTIILLLTIFLVYVYYYASKKTDHKLYDIPSTKIEVSKTIKKIFKILCYLYISVLLFYQHIIEILYFGVVRGLTTNFTIYSESSNFIKYNGSIVIAIINIIAIITLIVLMYIFFYMSSTESLSNPLGFKYSVSFLNVIFHILFFSLQGIYSTSFFLGPSQKENFEMGMCYIVTCLIGLNLICNFKHTSVLECGYVLKFMELAYNFCFMSGITEILIYHFGSKDYKSEQKYYVITFTFDFINGFLATISIEKLKEKLYLKKFASNIFLVNKSFNIESFFYFFSFYKSNKRIENNSAVLLYLFQTHRNDCNDEMCRCNKFFNTLSIMSNHNAIDKIFKKILYIGEKKITEQIKNLIPSKITLGKLLFFHCDFLFSIRENIPVTMYLCQYYLIKMRSDLNFKYGYMLYELNYLSKKKNLIQKKNKSSYKVFLQDNLLLDKIMKIIYLLCSDVERILHMKNIKNSNAKLLFTCEDILISVIEFVTKNKSLVQFINYYTLNQASGLSVEVKLTLYYYQKLFSTKLSQKTNKIIYNGKYPIPSYEDFEKINKEKLIDRKNALILFLTIDNKFIIRYSSTEINDILLYKRNELIGIDFNEFIVPKEIAGYHSIYMKEFILKGNIYYSKVSFLLNKANQLVPMKIKCYIQPTLSSLYTILVNLELVITDLYKSYYIISDLKFNLWSISESFENQLFFSMKMFECLKINYCDLFGVNKEKINEYFKNYLLTKNDRTPKIKICAETTVKNDELFFYDSIDPNWFKTYNKKDNSEENIKIIVVDKEKFINSLVKLGKNIEEMGLETEWKYRLNELYNKLKCKCQIDDYMSKNMSCGYTKKNTIDVFYLKFTLKKIGRLRYYVTTISEIVEENEASQAYTILKTPSSVNGDYITPFFSKEKEYAIPIHYSSSLGSSSLLFRDTLNSAGYSPKNPQVESITQTLGDTSSKFYLQSREPTKNSFSGYNSTNKSSSLLIPVPKKQNKDMKQENKSLFYKYGYSKEDNNSNNNSNIKKKTTYYDQILQKDQKNKFKIFKVLEIFFVIAIFMLNIGNFIYNQSSLVFSLNLFNINAYSFLLTNDIFYGSLASLTLCLIQDGIQSGDINNLQKKVMQSAKDLMNHYQLLNSYTTLMIKEDQTREIYNLFNQESEYWHILQNWEPKEYNSTLVGELYSFHYWLKQFNVTRNPNDNYCRISTFFFKNDFANIHKLTNSTPSTEEKLIYYICSNIVSQVSLHLENLTKLANQILKKENDGVKMGSLAISVAILLVALIFYIVVIINLNEGLKLFKGQIDYLFTQHEAEEILHEDIKRFKKLLDCFSKSECLDYITFKRGVIENINQDVVLSKYNLYVAPSRIYRFPALSTKKTESQVNLKQKSKISKTKFKKAELEPKKQEEIENKIEMTNIQFSKLSTPKYIKYSFLILTIEFFVFFGIGLFGLILSSNKYNGLIIENEFATSFLRRGPKLNELVLYSIISVVMNDPNYISKDQQAYKDAILSNYYDLTLDLESNSIFQTLGESNYAYLYYQIHIIRNNIHRFINSKELCMYLPLTTDNENLFNDGKNFCINAPYQYVKHYYEDALDTNTILEALNSEAKQCRTVGNGMNLNGYKSGIDLMLQQLHNLYYSFKSQNATEIRQLDFLQASDLEIIEDNLLNVVRSLHIADSFLVIDDINNSYHSIHQVKVYFSVASIGMICLVIFGVLCIIVIRIDYLNYVTREIVKIFDNSMKNYNVFLDGKWR